MTKFQYLLSFLLKTRKIISFELDTAQEGHQPSALETQQEKHEFNLGELNINYRLNSQNHI